MQRTQRLTLLSALTAAALAGVTATAGAQQEPQKPPAPVETGAVDSTKQMQPGQPETPAVAPRTGVTVTDTLSDKDKAKNKKAKPGETPDTTKPKN